MKHQTSNTQTFNPLTHITRAGIGSRFNVSPSTVSRKLKAAAIDPEFKLGKAGVYALADILPIFDSESKPESTPVKALKAKAPKAKAPKAKAPETKAPKAKAPKVDSESKPKAKSKYQSKVPKPPMIIVCVPEGVESNLESLLAPIVASKYQIVHPRRAEVKIHVLREPLVLLGDGGYPETALEGVLETYKTACYVKVVAINVTYPSEVMDRIVEKYPEVQIDGFEHHVKSGKNTRSSTYGVYKGVHSFYCPASLTNDVWRHCFGTNPIPLVMQLLLDRVLDTITISNASKEAYRQLHSIEDHFLGMKDPLKYNWGNLSKLLSIYTYEDLESYTTELISENF